MTGEQAPSTSGPGKEPPLADWEVVDTIWSGVARWPLATPDDPEAIEQQIIAAEQIAARDAARETDPTTSI